MFETPSFEEIRQSILRDTQSLDPNADISADSDHYVHASRLASMAVGLYAHQNWIVRQIFPDTADSEYLERHAMLRGLRRRNATTAAGTLTVNGINGSAVPIGLSVKVGESLYRTTSSAVIQRGSASVRITANESGIGSNKERVAAQLMAAPPGVSSDAVLQATGGTDAESDASLLARLLDLIRRPPAGGNQYDYKKWALSVDGVTSAFVYPLRRGLGTVDVAITSGDSLPIDETVRAVQDYIDSVRPVTAKNVQVIKPSITRVPISVQIKHEGITLPEAINRIKAALAEYFNSLAPGDQVIVSQIEAVISDVSGVVDRKMLSPSVNRVADVANKIEWFKLGTVNITAMVG